MTLVDLLMRHEGVKYKPYMDTVGKLTIGCGRNLDDVGISHAEMLTLLSNDIATATKSCEKYPWFESLSDARKAAVVSLMFNLGATRFAGFQKFIAAMDAKDYQKAGDELKDSKWYGQVGRRASEIIHLIKFEAWPT